MFLHTKWYLDPSNRLATIYQRHRQTGHFVTEHRSAVAKGEPLYKRAPKNRKKWSISESTHVTKKTKAKYAIRNRHIGQISKPRRVRSQKFCLSPDPFKYKRSFNCLLVCLWVTGQLAVSQMPPKERKLSTQSRRRHPRVDQSASHPVRELAIRELAYPRVVHAVTSLWLLW